MELERIFGAPVHKPDASKRHTAPAKEDTSDTFARMLQNLKESKAVEAREWAEKVGDTVITRILADGSVITQIYEGTKLVSQIVTRGAHPEAGKEIISETIEKMTQQARAQTADPLLLSRAAQGAPAAAIAAAAMQ